MPPYMRFVHGMMGCISAVGAYLLVRKMPVEVFSLDLPSLAIQGAEAAMLLAYFVAVFCFGLWLSMCAREGLRNAVRGS